MREREPEQSWWSQVAGIKLERSRTRAVAYAVQRAGISPARIEDG